MTRLAFWSSLVALFATSPRQGRFVGRARTCDAVRPVSDPATHAAMLEKIKESGLTEEDARACGFGAMLDPPPEIALPGAGFVLPYYTLEGKKNGFYRYRYLPPLPVLDKKPLRYMQPKGAAPLPYFAPLLDWAKYLSNYRGEKCRLLITEGELKAACACKFDIPCIGLGGVWNFKSKKESLIAGLKQLEWKDASVHIAYDSDTISNEQVLLAQNALARELWKRGARVYVCRLPALPERKKTGLDDYLVARGQEVFFAEVLRPAVLWAENEDLFRLNEEVLYIEDPGMILRRDTGQTMKCTDFVQHQYADRSYSITVDKKTVVKSTAREWIKWPYHARVNKLTYRPGEPELLPSTKCGVADELNLWPGWGVEPVRGDIGPWKELLDFLFRAAMPEDRRWFEQWVAYPIQHPGAKLHTGVLIWGRKHGTGKTLVGYTIGDIYGKNFTELNHQDLFGNFNGWAAGKQFALGEEIATGDTKNAEHFLKSLITRQSIRINEKYQVPYVLPDCINYLFTSNEPDALLLRNTDRRFFVLEVEGNDTPPLEFYAKRYNAEWRKKEGVAHLMYYLQHLGLSGFQPSAPAPMTVAKAEMIVVSRTDLQNWVQRLSDDPDAVIPHSRYSLYRAEELALLFNPAGQRGRTDVRSMGIALSEYLEKANRRGAGKKARVRGVIVDGNALKRTLYLVRDKETLRGMTETELAERYNQERKTTKY